MREPYSIACTEGYYPERISNNDSTRENIPSERRELAERYRRST